MRRTNESLNTINFTEDDFLSVVKKLNPNKARGDDQISIWMLKMWKLCKPLYFIFSSCIESGIFPDEWKMSSVVPVHKQSDRQNDKIKGKWNKTTV